MSMPRELFAARQMYRLCCGIEFALVSKGYRATVADALKAAGMSRRTFNEMFDSLHDAYRRMQIAMGRATERAFERARDKGAKEAWRFAYISAQSFFPSADTMLSAMSCDITIDANRMLHLEVPLDTASYIATQVGMRPLHESGPFDEQILLWANDMRAGDAK